MNKLENTFWVIGGWVLLVFLSGCAAQGTLTGGPKDVEPPVLVQDKSTPNFKTNVQDRSFHLEFDEYVKVEDVFNQIVVSPPLVYNPTVVARGRKVRFEFNDNETLREATTYTINFGTAIRDLNENNPAENVRFVFSTGDIIDSLSLEGQIIDAITGAPVSKAVALLYDDPNDSLIYTGRPYYFGKSDENGRFKIENIKAGTYQVMGLKDENQNFKFDDPKEFVGYFDSLIVISGETPNITIPIFMETGRGFVQDIDSTQKGRINIKFSQELIQPTFQKENMDVTTLISHKENSVVAWHTADERIRWWLYIDQITGARDSVRIRSYPLDSAMITKKLECVLPEKNRNTEHQDSVFYLGFSMPITELNTEELVLRSQTDSTFLKTLTPAGQLSFPLLELGFNPVNTHGSFHVEFPIGSMTDFYGRVNSAKLICPVVLLDKEAFSNLNLTLKGFKPEISYLVRFQLKGRIIREWVVKETETWKGSFQQLKPEAYEVFIIEDLNENRRWDPGKFMERRQPERKRTAEIKGLRANWDIDQEIDISDWYMEPTSAEEEEIIEGDEDGANDEDEIPDEKNGNKNK